MLCVCVCDGYIGGQAAVGGGVVVHNVPPIHGACYVRIKFIH